jgi:hypothetical protein
MIANNIKNMKRLALLSISIGFTLLALANPDSLHTNPNQQNNYSILGVSSNNAQIAIIANVAQNRFYGSQLSACFNMSTGYLRGFQMAGIGNLAMDSVDGAQIGGVMNIASKSVRGAQIAGTLNMAGGDIYGAQVSGTANVCGGTVEALQLAGTVNIAKNVRGLQTAGTVNIAFGTVQGAQISGFLNYARNVKGVQIGVFNFADSVSGAMIGVFSYARHGFHKLEFGWNETMPINGAFRSGSKLFHNNFLVGVDYRPRNPYWSIGYGIGTAWAVTKRIDAAIELSTAHVNRGGFNTRTSEWIKIEAPFDFKLANKISIAAGPTFNVFVNDVRPQVGELPMNQFPPYYGFTQTYDNRWNVKAWFGFGASIRFF